MVLLEDQLAFSHIQSDILIPHFKQLIPEERLSGMTSCHQRILLLKVAERHCIFHPGFCKVEAFDQSFNNVERSKCSSPEPNYLGGIIRPLNDHLFPSSEPDLTLA